MKKTILLLLCMALFAASGCFDGYSKSDSNSKNLLALLALIGGNTGGNIPVVSGNVANNFIKNELSVHENNSGSIGSVVTTTNSDKNGRFSFKLPAGTYFLRIYSTNPTILNFRGSGLVADWTYLGINDLYQIKQYVLIVTSDGKAQISGVALSEISEYQLMANPTNGLSLFGKTVPVLDNPVYLLSAKQVHMKDLQYFYGSGIQDVYSTYSYNNKHNVTQVDEYLGTGPGTKYATTTYNYNSSGNITSWVKDAVDDVNDQYGNMTYASDGIRPLSSYSKTGTTTGFGTDVSRENYSYDDSLRLTEDKRESFNSSSGTWIINYDIKFTYNADGTISEYTCNLGSTDHFHYYYSSGYINQLVMVNYNMEMNYTLNSYNLPTSLIQNNGTAPGQHIHDTGVYTYDPTSGLLINATFSPASGDVNAVPFVYNINYDSSGRQTSMMCDNQTSTTSDNYIDGSYDSNGNIDTIRLFSGVTSATGSPSIYATYTWVAR